MQGHGQVVFFQVFKQINIGNFKLPRRPKRSILRSDALPRFAARSKGTAGCTSHFFRSNHFGCSNRFGCGSHCCCVRSLGFYFLLMLLEPTGLPAPCTMQHVGHLSDKGIVPAIATHTSDAQSRALHQRCHLRSNFWPVEVFQLPDPIFAWRFCAAQTAASQEHSLHVPATLGESAALLKVRCHCYLVASGNRLDHLNALPPEDASSTPGKITNLEIALCAMAVAATALAFARDDGDVFQLHVEEASLWAQKGCDIACELGDGASCDAGTSFASSTGESLKKPSVPSNPSWCRRLYQPPHHR